MTYDEGIHGGSPAHFGASEKNGILIYKLTYVIFKMQSTTIE